jgi:hypothetical protein
MIVVLLNVISFDLTSSNIIDNALETKVEVSLEEKEVETKSDENLIANISELYQRETEVFVGFYFSIPIVDQLYLTNIFKPPILLNA